METIFFTGFPGFLGSELLPRVLTRSTSAEAVCLVQPKFFTQAQKRADELTHRHHELRNRIRLVPGDISSPDLGLSSAVDLERNIVEIFHLAAIYDLSVERDFAYRINVDGTRHLIALARRCPNLRRFQYVSTCYVSGRHQGPFTEQMLEAGQQFNNHYEETKYLAEVEVQKAMKAGLPASIYRPSIVVGDSRNGATQKFDGPYFAIQWLLRQPALALMPVVGNPEKTEFNVVPRDFVVDAIAHLSARPQAAGLVYNLADPKPLTVDKLLEELARSTGRKLLRLPMPLSFGKFLITKVPGVDRLFRIPASALDYFDHPTRYETEQAQRDLAAGNISCPRFTSYAPQLVHYMLEHPEVSAKAMA